MLVFFFKQKTASERRISNWSSDVCSSDLNSGFLFDWKAIGMGVHQKGGKKLLCDGLAELNRDVSDNCTALVCKARRGLRLPSRNVYRLYYHRDLASDHSDCLAQVQAPTQGGKYGKKPFWTGNETCK